MRHLLELPAPLLVALGACMLAVGVVVYLIISPRPVRLALSRRRPGSAPQPSLLTRAAGVATGALDRFLRRRGSKASTAALLELAGIKMRPQDFFLLIIASALGAAALGVLLSGLLLAIVFAVLVPVIVKVVLSIRTGRRQRAFDGQLDDALQMMASSLRAGHSLLQALDTVAREAQAPLSEEFVRVINETRVGRDLTQALDEIAVRMESKDMAWVTQAIAINRNVGGNLADVLDQVSGTIRERAQIKRQVKTLAAEGKLSAYVLMALPFGVGGLVLLVNPAYMQRFTESLLGYVLLGVAAVLMVIGGVWLRKVTTIKF